jgi:hypothetical protein
MVALSSFAVGTALARGASPGHSLGLGPGGRRDRCAVSAAVISQVLAGSRAAALTRREVPSGVMLRRLRFGLRTGALLGALTGVVSGLIVFPGVPPGTGPRFGALIGLTSAGLLMLLVAFAPITEQWLVRRRLAREDLVPRPVLPFLDYAVQCLFLRNVGDGYIFVHRELLDFFADRLVEPARPPAPRLVTEVPHRDPTVGA